MTLETISLLLYLALCTMGVVLLWKILDPLAEATGAWLRCSARWADGKHASRKARRVTVALQERWKP